MIKIKTIILTVFIAFLIINTVKSSELGSPEETVVNFTEAYQSQDWNKAVNYLHPNMINEIRDQILDIIRRVKKSGVQEILSSFGVVTLAELEKIPLKEFYVRNQIRWTRDTRQDLKTWKKMKYELVSSKPVRENEYLIGLHCTLNVGGQTKKKHSVFTVKLIEGELKILKSINQNKQMKRSAEPLSTVDSIPSPLRNTLCRNNQWKPLSI